MIFFDTTTLLLSISLHTSTLSSTSSSRVPPSLSTSVLISSSTPLWSALISHANLLYMPMMSAQMHPHCRTNSFSRDTTSPAALSRARRHHHVCSKLSFPDRYCDASSLVIPFGAGYLCHRWISLHPAITCLCDPQLQTPSCLPFWGLHPKHIVSSLAAGQLLHFGICSLVHLGHQKWWLLSLSPLAYLMPAEAPSFSETLLLCIQCAFVFLPAPFQWFLFCLLLPFLQRVITKSLFKNSNDSESCIFNQS